MPLSFDTTSHGRVAFGFFNIESDMLLLENFFFFADRFCEMIVQTTRTERAETFRADFDACEIIDARRVGHLMGAIQGVDHHGFIGGLYAQFPFPKSSDDFKQNPLGFLTRGVVKALISPFARKANLAFLADEDASCVQIGPFVFDRQSFQQLVQYVWLGGYPRWRARVAPPYVIRMKKAVQASRHTLFENLEFEDPGLPH